MYIPTNRNNLLSLGKWDAAGGCYIGGERQIILENKNVVTVASGMKTLNHLYKMKFKTCLPHTTNTITPTNNPQTFAIMEPMQNWEMWHRHFGHVSYTRLQNFYNKKIVEGFTVDINTPKPDCDACIQAKQTIALFNGKSDQNTKPGDLTHIDLWGKYQIKSIHGNQYYILFVDDAACYVTVFFLKKKEEAGQHVKNYLTNLKTHNKNLKMI